MKEKFINLLKNTKREGIEDLIDYLENKTDFFKAPASTKHHLAKEGGLLEHSLNVYERLSTHLGYNNPTVAIVALLHDICKANYYSVSTKNVKNDKGVWEQVPYYTVNDQIPLGHGEKSVIIIQRYIDLTLEEIMAIRWHMGGYEAKENYSYISKAFSNYPLALHLHIADLEAAYLDEKEEAN